MKILRGICFVAVILSFCFVVLDWLDFYRCGAVEQCLVDSSYWQNFMKFSVTVLITVAAFFIGGSCVCIRDRRLLQSAFITAVCADFCFKITLNIPALDLYHDFFNLLGICVFMVVQVLLIFRHSQRSDFDSSFPKILWIPFLVAVACAILFVIDLQRNITIAVDIIYFSFITCSLVTALLVSRNHYFPKNNARNIKWGMILFSCCDACVAISSAVGVDHSMQEIIATVAHNLVWIFYTPALLLLCQSGFKRNF